MPAVHVLTLTLHRTLEGLLQLLLNMGIIVVCNLGCMCINNLYIE